MRFYHVLEDILLTIYLRVRVCGSWYLERDDAGPESAERAAGRRPARQRHAHRLPESAAHPRARQPLHERGAALQPLQRGALLLHQLQW